jgi:hypothetical protein
MNGKRTRVDSTRIPTYGNTPLLAVASCFAGFYPTIQYINAPSSIALAVPKMQHLNITTGQG